MQGRAILLTANHTVLERIPSSILSWAMKEGKLLDALRRWEAREEPGHFREIAYPEYDSSTWQPIDLQEG